MAGLLLVNLAWSAPPKDESTAFIIDEGWELVKAHCTVCHSSKLVIQNKLSATGWLDTIRWMQQEQGLWDLGDAEEVILNYLAKNYGLPEETVQETLAGYAGGKPNPLNPPYQGDLSL